MNQPDPHAHLRAAFTAGCRIQAWHLNACAANSNDGRWDTLTPPEGREPEFGCEPHLYRVHPDDEAKALAAWNYQHPTMHLPEPVRFYIERLVSNTDPAGMVRENLLLREEVTRLSSLIAELGQEVGAVPSFRGYANLGVGAYLLEHSAEGEDAELCIVPATEAEKAGRTVGDLRHFEGEREPISAERMAVRIRFDNVAGLDALEQQLRLLREAHFPTAPAHTSEARDSERLDWIERAVTEKAAVWLLPSADHRFVQVRWSRGDIDNSPTAPNLREAIDAAMRQEGGSDD